LCVFGSVLGLTALVRELTYHASPPARAATYSGAALCVGIVLGLWVPRSVTRRRLARLNRRLADEGDAERIASGTSTPDKGPDLGFAASLTGVLILVLGLLWVLSHAGAATLETYRRFLTHRFCYAGDLTHGLLWSPTCLGLVLLGALATTALSALHGWHRLVTAPHTKVAELWAVILSAAALGGVAASRMESRSMLGLLAPLAVFLAGALSVFRETGAASWYVQKPPRSCAAAEALPLLMAAFAAAVTGIALLSLLAGGPLPSDALGVQTAVLTGALLGGLILARLLLRWPWAVQTAPLALLFSAAALLLPYPVLSAAWANPDVVRLGLGALCASACVVLIGRRLGRASGSVQYALSWVGVAVAAGMGLTLALGPLCAEWLGSSMLLVTGGLIAIAVAGLALILDAGTGTAVRLTGLATIGLCLLLVPLTPATLRRAPHRPDLADETTWESPAARAGRSLLTPHIFRTARVSPGWVPGPGQRRSAWQIDLDGRRWDAVLIERTSYEAWQIKREPDAHRLIRRCTGALARGGRLIIELPADALTEAARADLSPAHRLRVARRDDVYEALVFGPDVPAWIAQRPRPEGFEVSLHPAPQPSGARAADTLPLCGL
jgi:hypothetical protein